jgi:hypothetical protein
MCMVRYCSLPGSGAPVLNLVGDLRECGQIPLVHAQAANLARFA